MTENETPVTALREKWTREAQARIAGREAFERTRGKSTKPLAPIEVDPRDLLRVLTDTAELTARVEAVLQTVNAHATSEDQSPDEQDAFGDVAIWLTKALHPDAFTNLFSTDEAPS